MKKLRGADGTTTTTQKKKVNAICASFSLLTLKLLLCKTFSPSSLPIKHKERGHTDPPLSFSFVFFPTPPHSVEKRTRPLWNSPALLFFFPSFQRECNKRFSSLKIERREEKTTTPIRQTQSRPASKVYTAVTFPRLLFKRGQEGRG